jgi:hypothetical protein
MSEYSPLVVISDVASAIFWLVAYAGILYRGYQDKSYGMPIAALATNISWEACFAFLIDPFSNQLHLASIGWFIGSVLILGQTLRYGAKEFDNPTIRNNFPLVVFGSVAIAFPLVYLFFRDFGDPEGAYAGFGANFLMSILFVVMLLRRGSPRGQSMYIAMAKLVGTFFAWLSTALIVTTSPADPVPDSLVSFVTDSVTHANYPLTPLINYLYLVIFVIDIMYVILLHRSFKAAKLRPWRF